MRKMTIALLMMASLILGLVGPAGAEDLSRRYTITKEIREDGHLKMWWTKDGYRITEYPFIDNDFTSPTDCYWVAPSNEINDSHEQWIRSSNGKKTSMSAVAGIGYPFATFDQYFAALGTDSVSWYTLADTAGELDVEIQIDLVVWGQHLKTQPMPDPMLPFLFVAGQCPMLPGHMAINGETSDPFDGTMQVVGMNTLAVPEPATVLLLALGGLGVVGRVTRRPRRS